MHNTSSDTNINVIIVAKKTGTNPTLYIKAEKKDKPKKIAKAIPNFFLILILINFYRR